jgi:hypothetical protein
MGSNLDEVKCIISSLKRCRRNLTPKELAYFDLELKGLLTSKQSKSESTEPEPTDLHERLQITEVREAINSKRVKEGLIPFV